MNRDRILLGLGGALIVAFLASSFVYRQIQRAQHEGGAAAKTVPVVVAAGSLKLGQPLGPSDLALVEWPAGKQPQGSFSRVEDCVGRALMVPLVQDEVVLEQQLAGRDAGAGLPVSIPAGMRAVSVGVDDVVAVAGFVTPGTVVDVLVTGSTQGGASMTRTILEHVRVLAVGQQLQSESGKPQTAPVVTLLVTPEDGERLTLASAEGKIHLALRNTVDTSDANTPPVYGYSIFLGSAPAGPVVSHVVQSKPAPPPIPPYNVQVIRGDKVETQSFPR